MSGSRRESKTSEIAANVTSLRARLTFEHLNASRTSLLRTLKRYAHFSPSLATRGKAGMGATRGKARDGDGQRHLAMRISHLPLQGEGRDGDGLHHYLNLRVADPGLVTFSCAAKRRVTKEKAAPVSRPLWGFPVLLAVQSGCGSRSKNEKTRKGCELRQVLAEIPFHGCDCSATHEGSKWRAASRVVMIEQLHASLQDLTPLLFTRSRSNLIRYADFRILRMPRTCTLCISINIHCAACLVVQDRSQ